MTWIGWNPYAEFWSRLAANPVKQGKAALEAMEPQEFRAARASVPFTNTPARASSTFVRNIRYLPNSQISFVRLGNNQYWYPMTMRRLAQWLNSESLGRYYNNYIKLRG